MAVILHVVMIYFWVLHLPPWIGLPLWKWFKSVLEFFNVVQVITNYTTHYSFIWNFLEIIMGTFWNAGVNILSWHMTPHIHVVLKPSFTPWHKILKNQWIVHYFMYVQYNTSFPITICPLLVNYGTIIMKALKVLNPRRSYA